VHVWQRRMTSRRLAEPRRIRWNRGGSAGIRWRLPPVGAAAGYVGPSRADR
jgi:hypothetical protein